MLLFTYLVTRCDKLALSSVKLINDNTTAFDRRPTPVYHLAHRSLCTARCAWDSASRGSICDSTYLSNVYTVQSVLLLHANLDSLAARREDLSAFLSVILWILPPVFTASFLHPDPPLSPLGSDLLKSFLKSILVPSAIVLFIQYGLNHYQ